MISTLLLDADGVTLVKQGYFSEVYSKEYGVPLEKITPFFKNDFRVCQLGQKDLKDVLPAYLAEWGWGKSLEDFLQYWFAHNTIADDVVVNKVQEIRQQGVQCYLVTDQEKYRAEYTRNTLGFSQKFDGCFFSCELGYSKAQPEFFTKVLEQLKIPADQVKYLDDEQENLDAARQVGIQAEFYKGIEDLHA